MTTASPDFPAVLQDFFHRRLINERGVSAHTIASYRDTFTLLLRYAEQRTGRAACTLSFQDIDAPLILDFLDHLEADRGNSARTRNLRLTAIRSFMRYASLRDPTCLPVAQRVLSIGTKRFDRPALDFLSHTEITALLDAPDTATWSGHRDAALFTVLYNSGARVAEAIGLTNGDILDNRTSIHLHGKGRKDRVVPLWKNTASKLRAWQARIDPAADAPVFPNRHGRALSRSGVEHRLGVAVTTAAQRCPSLAGRRVTPHTLRHTTAMHLLQSGVNITVIALWLGHEDTATTHLYIEADLAMKEAAINRLHQPSSTPVRFKPPDRLLAFLEDL